MTEENDDGTDTGTLVDEDDVEDDGTDSGTLVDKDDVEDDGTDSGTLVDEDIQHLPDIDSIIEDGSSSSMKRVGKNLRIDLNEEHITPKKRHRRG
jgi:hypothetical protein